MKKCISLLMMSVLLISLVAISAEAASTDIGFSKLYKDETGPCYINQTFASKSGLLKFTDNTSTNNKQLSLNNLKISQADMKSKKYIIAECYLDDPVATDFAGLVVTFCKTTKGWTFDDKNTEAVNYRVCTAIDGTYPAKKWVKVVIDAERIFNWLTDTEKNPSETNLEQFRLSVPALSGDAAFYISRVYLSSDFIEPQVYTDNGGQRYTYLSEDGKVTVDGAEIDAFATVTEAFTALGTEGGTVYLEGTLNAFADVGKGVRGDVLLRGLGDTEEDIKRNIINGIDIEVKGGNITFDYLTVNPGTMGESEAKYASFYSCQRDYTDMGITIGAHVESAGIAIGNKKPYENGTVYWANADKVTINGGNFYSITPTSNYGSRFITRLGTIDYTINGGKFNALYAGSNNSWEWENSEIRGDVKYTINGGNFTNHMVMGSAYGATNIQGNIIWTINGGVMGNRRIVGGNKNDAQKSDRQKNLNNVAAVVNLKGEKTGLSGLTLGTDGAKGKHINENEIYILNNYEDNTGTKIANGSLAEYKMHVYCGKAEPVFANDQTVTVSEVTKRFGGSLIGFTLIPDETGAVPYVNGKAVEPDLNGRYQIAADTGNIIEVVFVKDRSSKIISFTASDTTVSVKAYNYSDDMLSAMIYIAEYDDKNSLENVIVYPINIETSAEVQTVTQNFLRKDGSIYRAFLWNSTSIMPLAKALDLTGVIIDTKLKSNVEILCNMGIVDGEQTEEYMQAAPTRLDMAKAALRLTGEYQQALNYHGSSNFSDANEENYNILSYIYAYKCFGIVGDGNNNLMADEPLAARTCYKMILSILGYECGNDFALDTMQQLCYQLGIGDMFFEETFTNKDMCNAIYEAFNVPLKGTETYFVDYLYEEGKILGKVWNDICYKQDRITPLLDGEYEIPPNISRNGEFTFTFNEWEHTLQKSSFAYNSPFHYAGIYYGTLPESDPRSKKQEFGEAMTKAGARAMRFPGGTPAHQYFIEGEEFAIQLNQKSKRFNYPWGGLYDSDDYNNAWYVDFWDWLDFCKEYDIDPIFQMNPSFFVDENGEVRQAYPFRVLRSTDKGIITSDELYDHNRIEEAIAAFGRNLDKIVERGYEIHYWELGNEDNFANYSALPVTDPKNPLTQDFIKAITGYARAIKERFPDAYITVCSGFPYKELMAPEDYALLTSTTKHYPFGRWTIPPEGERTSAARLVGTNEQNFLANYSKDKLHKDQLEGALQVDNTETMTWRFEAWDPNSLQHTFAQALNTAHNWGELVFDSGFIGLNVMHDLESPWFGSVVYDVSMDPGNRYMRWNRNVNYTVHKDDVPDLYKFEDSYYYNPCSKAFEMLGRHCGEKVLTNSQTNVDRRISGYASLDEENNEIRFTVVNRFNENIPVKIALPNITVSEQSITQQIMRSDYLRAMLEIEYENYETTIKVYGNADDPGENAIEFEATPRSVNQFVVKLDRIKK